MQSTFNHAVLIGIAGGSGSGKSTLAGALRAAFGPDRCSVVSFDDYYRDLEGLSPEVRAQVNFDHPDSLDHELFGRHLDALRAGRGVEVPVYDFASHARTAQTVAVPARPIVIAEGILLFAGPAIVGRLDLRVFVEAEETLRLRRRIRRDSVERGRSESSVRAQFAATVGPMHTQFVAPSAARAEIIVSGADPFDEAVEAIVRRGERALQTGFQDP